MGYLFFTLLLFYFYFVCLNVMWFSFLRKVASSSSGVVWLFHFCVKIDTSFGVFLWKLTFLCFHEVINNLYVFFPPASLPLQYIRTMRCSSSNGQSNQTICIVFYFFYLWQRVRGSLDWITSLSVACGFHSVWSYHLCFGTSSYTAVPQHSRWRPTLMTNPIIFTMTLTINPLIGMSWTSRTVPAPTFKAPMSSWP